MAILNLNNDKKKLAGNFIWLGVLQASNYALPLLTTPYIFRVLGEKDFGIIMTAQYFIQLFIFVCDYGFAYTATKNITLNKDNRTKVSRIFWSVIIIKCCLCIFSVISLTALLLANPNYGNNYAVYVAMFAMVLGQILFPVWLFQGFEKMQFITIISVIPRIITTITMFILVKDGNDTLMAAVLMSVGYLAGGIISFIFSIYKFKIKIILPAVKELKREFKDGWIIFLSIMGSSIYTTGAGPMLSLLTHNDILVGYFAAADKLVRGITSMYNPIIQGFFPYIAHKMKQSVAEGIRTFRKYFIRLTALTLCGSLGIFFLGGWVGTQIFGPDFENSIEIIKILSVIPLFGVTGQAYAYLLYNNIGWSKKIPVIYFTGSFSFILLSYLLIHQQVNHGVAWALAVTEMIVPIIFVTLFKLNYKAK